MKIINPFENYESPVVLTIGMFDGVHRGHQLLLNKAIEVARNRGAQPAVYTFANHPIKERRRYFITSIDEKLYLLKKFGIEAVFLNELSDELMHYSPDEFIQKELLMRTKPKAVIVGEDFRFGFERSGTAELLYNFLKNRNIETYILPTLTSGDTPIKSSTIARLIKEGLIVEANKLLGYMFFLSGSVVRGKGLGRHLGFPTANLKYINGNKVLPKNGVYITIGEVNNKFCPSVSNVGFNPTFESDNKIKVEVHFLDVDLGLYGEFMRLYFVERLRDERKFESTEDLKAAVSNDIEKSKEYFKKQKINCSL